MTYTLVLVLVLQVRRSMKKEAADHEHENHPLSFAENEHAGPAQATLRERFTIRPQRLRTGYTGTWRVTMYLCIPKSEAPRI